MIIEKVIGNISNYDHAGKTIDKVWIDWFETDKKLMRKTSESGEELGIRLESPIGDGDVLFDDGEKVIVVDILPSEVVAISVESMKEMGRLCFELGNRHLTLSIENNLVTVPYDEPTFLYLLKLGFNAKKIDAKFTASIVCKGHSHSDDDHDHHHSHDHDHSHTHSHDHGDHHHHESDAHE